MEDFGLPMSFGKKAKGPSATLRNKTAQANVAQTKREAPVVRIPSCGWSADFQVPSPPVKVEEATTGKPSTAEGSDDDIGPMPPSAKRKASDDEASDDDAYEEEDRTPVTHEIVLKDHTKVGQVDYPN